MSLIVPDPQHMATRAVEVVESEIGKLAPVTAAKLRIMLGMTFAEMMGERI